MDNRARKHLLDARDMLRTALREVDEALLIGNVTRGANALELVSARTFDLEVGLRSLAAAEPNHTLRLAS
jgi:hypothetical protein